MRSYLLAMANMAVAEHEAAVAGFREALQLALEQPGGSSRLVALAAAFTLRGASSWVPRAWVEPAAALVDRVPLTDASWLTVLYQLYALRSDLDIAVADVAAAQEDVDRRGCLAEWVGNGPEGPTALFDWSRDPPDGFLLQPESWSKPQNRPVEPEVAWHPQVYMCNLTLGRKREARAGVIRIASVVDVPEGLRTALLHVNSDMPFLVRIDGSEVARHDPYREAIGSVFDYELTAPPGRHRLDLQFGSSWGRPTVAVALLGIDADGRALPLPSSADLSVETPPAFTGELRELGWRPLGTWDALVALDVLDGFGRTEAAARGAEQLADSEWGRGNALVQLRAAGAVLRDPTLTVPEARRRAKTRFDALGELAGGLQPSVYAPARWSLEDGDLDDAIRLLRAALELFPNDSDILQDLQAAYGQRGWIEESRRAVEALEAVMPDSCAVKRVRLSFAYDLGQTDAIRQAVDDMLRCLPSSFDRLSLLTRERRWTEVIAEIERLRPLYGDPDQPDNAVAMTRLQTGDVTGLEELLRARLAEMPENENFLDLLVNLLLRAGRRDEAIALLDETFARGQSGNPLVAEDLGALQGFDPYSPLYIPAPLAIAEYEARRGPQEAPATQVLDHTVSRILDDGTIRMITHTILKLSSQEAIEQYGQSGGGGALAARTIAPDGTVTNVVNISQAGVGSFPDLTPGCYIETFTARFDPPSPLLQGGTDHWRFYFRSTDETMARTQFDLIAPAGDPLDFSPRAQPPSHQQQDLGPLRLHRWQGRDVPPLRMEPMSVQSDTYVPSMRVSRNMDWARVYAGLADALYSGDYVPLEVGAFARDKCGWLDEAGCARVLYDWILDNVEAGDFGETVAATYQRRAGSRARLLVALLRAAGHDPHLLLATSIDRDQTETPVAEAGRYYYPVIDVAGTFLTIEADEAPFGFLPAEIRGMPAVLFDPPGRGFETVRLPERPDLQEGIVAGLDLAIDVQSGDVRVEGEIEITGGFAADFRDGLLERSPADREGDLTGIFVSSSFPGADVESISIDGLEDREAPLVVHFVAHARGLAVRRGGSLLLPPLLPQTISGGYAPLPTVEHPALAFPPTRVDLRARIHAEGWRVGGVSGAGVDASGVRFEQQSADESDGGTLQRTLSIQRARLEPDEYPPFAQAVRRAENLWNMPIELRAVR